MVFSICLFFLFVPLIKALEPTCESDGLHYQCLGETQKCIPMSWMCDGRSDCPDGDDENGELCEPRGSKAKVFFRGQCLPRQFECEDLFGKKKCILEEWRCDRHIDCKNGIDEEDCDYSQRPETQLQLINAFDNTNKLNCSDDQFLCKNIKECVPKSAICDGRKNCLDGTDEWECAESSSAKSSMKETQQSTEWKANRSQQITAAMTGLRLTSTPIQPSQNPSSNSTIINSSTHSNQQQSTKAKIFNNNNRILPTAQTNTSNLIMRIARGSTEIMPISPRFVKPVSAMANKPQQVSMHRISGETSPTNSMAAQNKNVEISSTTETLKTTMQPVVFMKRENNWIFPQYKSIGNYRPIIPQL